MTRGINRAYTGGLFESNFAHSKDKCIFISHKYEDLDAAREVAEYIMDYGIDVYLDDRDDKLQQAVMNNDSKKIVSCIEDGIKNSTHILILVTEHTRMSWWVPYETGYAKMGEKGIASLLLKETKEFPDYLKIEECLNGFKDLTNYLEDLLMLSPIMESALLNAGVSIQNRHRNSLLNYISR